MLEVAFCSSYYKDNIFFYFKTKNILDKTIFSVSFPSGTSDNLKGFGVTAFKNNSLFLNDLVLFVHEVTSLFLIE